MLASRTHWRILVATVAVLMAAAFVAPRAIPPPDIQENRLLAPRPAWPARLADIAAFRKGADAYVADNFPARPHLIALLNRLRMMVGVSGSNRVIVGRDGWLFFDDDSHMGAARNDPPLESPQIRAWLMTLAGRSEYVRARGGAYLLVSPPYKEMIYPREGPAWYLGPALDRPGVVLPRFAAATGAGEALSLYPAIAAATARGEKTYSRHDTHWTGYGAYAGYAALMTRLHQLGLAEGPRPLSDFPAERLGRRNTPRDLARMLGVASMVQLDYPHFANPAGEAKLRRTYLGEGEDWTSPQVWETGEVGKPTLLMMRDSYSNELLPFMLSHFSRIVLSHNQDGFWRQDLIDRFKPDIVISEIIEPGLSVALREGPAPSATTAARIDRVLAVAAPPGPPSAASATPSLARPDARQLAAMNGARITPNCNFEVASLTPGVGGEASLAFSGWISELAPTITSPEGLVRLRGAGFDGVAAIRVDRSRPDVAAYYRKPTGEKSGFLGTFLARRLAAGAYSATAYRRSADGWIACPAHQVLTKP